MAPRSVVKVGGSLYDLPDLGARLRGWLRSAPAPTLLFPGGGAAADVVRGLDRIHALGDDAAHWLAIRSLSLNAHFLARLLGDTPVVDDLTEAPGPATAVVDPYAFHARDAADPDHLPHRWDVTSDSLALRMACVLRVPQLVLLKSCDWPGDDWAAAAASGVVDGYFPELARRACCRIHVVNLREWLALGG